MKRASRIGRSLLPLGLLGMLLLSLRFCVPIPIADLVPVEVSRLPASALPQSSGALRETLIRRGEKVWRLSLEGDSRWVGEVRSHELNGYAIVARCDAPDLTLLALGPYVGTVPITAYGEGFDRLDASGRRTLSYDIYLPERGRYSSEADRNAAVGAYDLGRAAPALCVRIAGGAMTGAYGRSNEVRLSVQAGRPALAGLSRPRFGLD